MGAETGEHRDAGAMNGAAEYANLGRSEADVRADVDKITDGLGHEIDPGIKDAVTALRVAGLPTSGSCEGHLEDGLPFPWVEVNPEGPEGWHETPEGQEAYRAQLSGLRQRADELLEAFYAQHTAPSEVRLKAVDMGIWGGFIIQSPDQLQDTQPASGERLTKYREEMDAFAEFLLHGNK